jgi:acyl-coenzyme A synthetase/AMP-(fatty) acid ligase
MKEAASYSWMDGFALCCGGDLILGAEIARHGESLAIALQENNVGRLAVTGNDMTSISVALKACLLVGCELVLLRQGESVARDVAVELQIEAVFSPITGLTLGIGAATGPRGFSLIIPTSGTTGRPKWASHSLETLLSSAAVRTRALNGSRFLLTFQGASFAGVQFMLSAMSAGGELYYLQQPSIEALASLARKFPPHVASGTPTFWRAFLLTLANSADRLPLRYITLGGEIVDQSILDTLQLKFPKAKIRHIYASTEVGAIPPVEDGLAGLPAEWLQRPDYGLAIIDGEFFVRRKKLERRYYAGERETDVPEATDFVATGDLVEVADGRIIFKGRSDAVINVGGAKVNPEEVERVLLSIPNVADAFVYGQRSSLAGFVVAADVVLSGNIDPSKFQKEAASILQKSLLRHKIPGRIRCVEALHRSESGKLLRMRQNVVR